MCELFAMSAREPATVRLSMSELARHGGELGPNRDGCGVAFVEGRDVRRFREAGPIQGGALLAMLERHDYRSQIVLVHLRRATQGAAVLRNTHPFLRELGGRIHSFAHNGELADVRQHVILDRFQPVGDTDSEIAFCGLMNHLATIWPAPVAASSALPELE